MRSPVQEGSPGGRTYRECWDARGRESFFLTEHVGYRMGAVIAAFASRTPLTPNTLSVASLLLGITGVFAALNWTSSALWQGVVILVVGLVSYGLDCADGVLARVTGQASRFGALLDKFVDWQRSLITLCLLYFLSPPAQMSGMGRGMVAAVFVLVLATRSGVALSFWLQELLWHDKADRPPSAKARDLRTQARKSLGIVVDEVFYVVIAATGWMLEIFWQTMLVYGLVLLLVMLAYLIDLKRRMISQDA